MPKKDPRGEAHAQNIVEQQLVGEATKQTKKLSEVSAIHKEENEEPNKSPEDFVIPHRCNAELHKDITTFLESCFEKMDYRYSGYSAFFRAALEAYIEGMPITEGYEKTKLRRVPTSVRVDKNLYDFYKGLPDRHKTAIIERVLRSFLKVSKGLP